MTRNELLRRFPHAKESFLRLNAVDTVGTSLPHPEQRECPAQLGADHARETQGPGCPLVRFTLCRVRLLDVDAKYGSTKDLLDGLQHAGLIRGDKEGQITLEVNQVKVKSFKQEKTIIEII